MSPRLKPWIGFGIALAGLAVALAAPVVGALVAFVGYFAALFATVVLNLFTSRLATRLAGVAYAGGVYLATDNAVLAGAAALMVMISWPPPEIFGRISGKLFDMQAPSAFVIGLVALLVAGPFQIEWLVFAPVLAWNAFGGLASVIQLKGSWPWMPDRMAIQIGSEMPDFELSARAGRPPFKLSEERGTPLLLCFLRGDWCPICQVMMRIYVKEAPKLAEYGLKLVVVSPSFGNDADEFFAQMGLDYVVLIDEKAKLATRLGLLEGERNGESFPLPVSLLIDADGALRYVSRPHDFSAFDGRSKVLALLDAQLAELAA